MTTPDIAASITWEPGVERDGDHYPVTVHFVAAGWQPYVPATWEQPAEGGLFEDIEFARAELAEEGEPLTDAEIEAARAWFETQDWPLSDRVQAAALAAEERPDPDVARDEAWDRAQMAEMESF